MFDHVARILDFGAHQGGPKSRVSHNRDGLQNGYWSAGPRVFRVELCQTTLGATAHRILESNSGGTCPNGGDEHDNGCGQTSLRALGRYCVGGGVGLRKSA